MQLLCTGIHRRERIVSSETASRASQGTIDVLRESMQAVQKALLNSNGLSIDQILDRLQEWQREGVWERIWQAFLGELDQRGKLDWSRAFLDGTFAPAKKGARQ